MVISINLKQEYNFQNFRNSYINQEVKNTKDKDADSKNYLIKKLRYNKILLQFNTESSTTTIHQSNIIVLLSQITEHMLKNSKAC